jgi:hypothetical protein
MQFKHLMSLTAVLECPNGEGNLCFGANLHLGSLLSYRERRSLANLQDSHARQGRSLYVSAVHAFRGNEKRLKGRAKLLKGSGEL